MVTASELAVLTAARPEVPLHALPMPGAPGFYTFRTGPCPFLRADGLCDVHTIRPYNCRRYLCGRDDPINEPFDDAPVPAVVMRTRALRRLYARNQREAQRWANAHGWAPHD